MNEKHSSDRPGSGGFGTGRVRSSHRRHDGRRSTTLIDFGADDSSEWTVVNDGVMGGVSRSEHPAHRPEDRHLRGRALAGEQRRFRLGAGGGGPRDLSRPMPGWRSVCGVTAAPISCGCGRTTVSTASPTGPFSQPVTASGPTVRRSFTDFEPTFRGRIAHRCGAAGSGRHPPGGLHAGGQATRRVLAGDRFRQDLGCGPRGMMKEPARILCLIGEPGRLSAAILSTNSTRVCGDILRIQQVYPDTKTATAHRQYRSESELKGERG